MTCDVTRLGAAFGASPINQTKGHSMHRPGVLSRKLIGVALVSCTAALVPPAAGSPPPDAFQ